jgi:hypothetical protein
LENVQFTVSKEGKQKVVSVKPTSSTEIKELDEGSFLRQFNNFFEHLENGVMGIG